MLRREALGRRPRRELNDWQIDVIRKVVDPRAWEMYEALGYARPEFAAGSGVFDPQSATA